MLERLRTEIFPEAVKTGSFGPDVKKFISFEQSTQTGTDQFASDVVFGDVILETKRGQLVTEHVTIKVQPKNEAAHKVFDCDAQFSNEILFYTEIITLFQKHDTDGVLKKYFPEYVYGKATKGVNPQDDIIVLKNLNSKGFKLTDERVFIDKQHIDLAIEGIGKFHALSYKCLHDDPVGFKKIVSKIGYTHRDHASEPDTFIHCLLRGINPLKEEAGYRDRLDDVLKHTEKGGFWREKYMKPSETLNVITHGDFCRNNMMFKYGDDGQPIDVVFFDLATIKFCSPTIDTSFLLMFNTSPELKRVYWDDFVKLYYDALSSQMVGHPAKPTFDEVLLDLRTKGVYGYHLCSFFQPMMLSKKTKEDMEDLDFNDQEAMLRLMLETGGDEATECLAEVVRFMLDKEFILDK